MTAAQLTLATVAVMGRPALLVDATTTMCKVRGHGFATVRPDGARRIYGLDPTPLREVDAWLDHFRAFWSQRLDALGTEVARGKRARSHD